MANNAKKRELIYDLQKYLNKNIFVKFIGGREIIGRLTSYDDSQNLVLEEPDKRNNEWFYNSRVVCLGNSIISISLISQ
ncbi:hypothetical protein CWI38_0128p0070 [Hamiltosporidium tvaerminnensis]|uniref:Sm domain-containing protein n=1 Tax=Hamiltosporidium tvaerminnensis TaxID=1176355 RepID=A0A4Q9L581_9MICR|nr:Sm-like protein lsm7 [Hamiltosporidium tvaerminnensis]TBU02634.1 hypothetical protein CWI37_0440p0010 [Hamiltosporidium tvaerminnensis]TBU20128.1 hypothetical protein CWI38_0128p0070 [Hamiltosporidium tvaerminnensis]